MSDRNWISPCADEDAELETIIEKTKRKIQECFVGVAPCRATVMPALAKTAQEDEDLNRIADDRNDGPFVPVELRDL